jgi:hypothetical protein
MAHSQNTGMTSRKPKEKRGEKKEERGEKRGREKRER